MREENPCDIFILSLHLSEEEYGLKVLDTKKAWFRALAAAGADVVWAHHPHVLQDWELSEVELLNEETPDSPFKHKKNAFSSQIDGSEAQGTTPRRLTDLIGSLCDLTSGSGDKGTPIIFIQGYFNKFGE